MATAESERETAAAIRAASSSGARSRRSSAPGRAGRQPPPSRRQVGAAELEPHRSSQFVPVKPGRAERTCASRRVASKPSSLATDPTISASTRSALIPPGRDTSEEKPSSTSIVPAGTSRARLMAVRARRAASALASTAYTLLAPARAAISASSAKGPVPMSRTISWPSFPRSRRRMASSKSGVRRASSAIAFGGSGAAGGAKAGVGAACPGATATAAAVPTAPATRMAERRDQLSEFRAHTPIKRRCNIVGVGPDRARARRRETKQAK
eukprot:scaffold4967_cov116-Isochrysis_galbana.AAC.7